MKFDNRVAIVFGADEIGAAITKSLNEQGVKVTIADADKAKADKVSSEIGGDVVAVACDVDKNADVKATFADVIEKHEKVDIVIYNVWWNERKPAEEVSDELLDKILDKNAKSCFRVVRMAAKKMKKNRHGRIISTIALSGIMGIPGEVAFSMAHATIVGLIRSTGREISRRRITVNGVGIGFVDNAFYGEHLDDETKKMASIAQFIQRAGKIEEITDAVLMFASDDSSWTTGEILLVGGGAYPR